MADLEELKSMVLGFRVSELQMLLGFAQHNKSGRKTELRGRALALLNNQQAPIIMKIKELYKSSRLQNQAVNGAQAPQSTGPNKELVGPPTLTPNMPQPQPSRPSAYQHAYTPQTAQDNRAMQTRSGVGPLYTPNIYNYHNKVQSYPIQPDVNFRRLPFFDVLAELLKPSTLIPHSSQRMQECSFTFHLTPQQATDIASNRDTRNATKIEHLVQVQLRFCLMETSCEQEDNFPPNVIVKVNNKLCPLPNPIPTNRPNVEPKRPPRPVNVTSMVKLSPTVSNTVNVSWAADFNRGYTVTILLVRKNSSSELLSRLKIKGSKHSDYTRGLIKEKLNEDADCEVATTSLRVSLVCPLGKIRMTTPCRASTCSHLQCFDASLYLQMNEKKATWMCPVCDKPALYDNLVVDGYFQEVLNSTTLQSGTNEVQLHKDGSWSSQLEDKRCEILDTPIKPKHNVEVISDDLEVITVEKLENIETPSSTSANPTPGVPKEKEVVVDLTLSDSDDDMPLKRKVPQSGVKADSTGPVHKYGTRYAAQPQAGNIVPVGPSSVSSSGYRSPSIITLDSPSPPRLSSPLTNSGAISNYQINPMAATNLIPAHQANQAWKESNL